MIRIFEYGEVGESEIFDRADDGRDVASAVRGIIADVRANGDAAVRKYTEMFDGASPERFEADRGELEAAAASVEPEFLDTMRRAAANIEAFHRRQVRSGFVISDRDGVVTGQRVLPIARVGLYIPGGTAGYPSSALMNCIPAKIAGVGEIIMATPPGADGGIKNPYIVAAALIAGVDRVFKIGGAQAVAALAYGTRSIPAVDKLVGPGNAYVAEAKRQVYGQVGIDMIAGPSEILVIADGGCDAAVIAADMLSQAEHDERASAVLITVSRELACGVSGELERRIPSLPRADIARASIDRNGKIIVAASIEQAIAISNRLAPEHLELCLDNPFDFLSLVENAGSVFLGKHCPEAVGDYCAGPNHTLPTSGTARFYSPLSVDDFIKKSSFTYYSREALGREADDVALFAEKEGLTAHARSVRARFEGGGDLP
ncbi:MAG: histidinol dehydrogenase [Oscillospiraceae bacterium]|jgi:histidinol dehydrogenase|nr:histidinol dehydrogenase [Oscillospiraceae bacterium]